MALLYLGPGLGGGIIALIIAFLISIIMFLAAIIWYPVKKVTKLLKRKKGKFPNSDANDTSK